MSKSKTFYFLCLSFVGGIFLNSLIQISQLLMLGFLILAIFFISIFWNYKKFVIFGFCILFLVLGIWRHQRAELGIINNELRGYNDSEEKITLIGIVVQDPDIREKNIKLTISNIQLFEVEPRTINGKVLVTTRRYPEYRYGDKLKITGFLKTPQNFEDFNYKNYLAKDGTYSLINYPEIKLIEKNQGNFIYSKILEIKDRLRRSIYQNLSPPQSSILGALILGDKRQISTDLAAKLNYAGVRHITAVSGLHVAILTSILMSFLIGIGFWRQQAFYFAIILITLFIIITGLQPSAIRAGIMGGLFLLAQHLGRLNVSSRAIVFAGVLMLAQNPLLLRLDVGFQLSFLAIIGIIYLLPIFQNWFRKFPDFLQLKNIIAMTFSAQIFTLPILIYNFGYFSLVAPLSNILILPLLPYIMGLGFLFAILGLIFQPLGWVFSLPTWFLLTYLIKIIDWSSGFSFSAFFLEISWIWLAASYITLGLLIWYLNKKQRLRFLNY